MKKWHIALCLFIIVCFPIFCIATVHNEEMAAIPTTETATEIVSETEQETETQPITEEWIATGYCPCEKCCGKWALNRPHGVINGAGGYELIQGKSMASALPYGTVVKMTGADGYNGLYVCHDRPADFIVERYHGKIIDLFFNSHAQAVEFGKRTVTIEIVEVTP